MTERAWPSRVAIVGAGTMGIGISHVFAASGIATVLVDATPDQSLAARERAIELLSRLEAGRQRRPRHVGDGGAAPVGGVVDRGRCAGGRARRRGRRRASRRQAGRLLGDRGGGGRRRSHRDEHVVHPDHGARGGPAEPGPLPGRALVRASAPRSVRRGDRHGIHRRTGRRAGRPGARDGSARTQL